MYKTIIFAFLIVINSGCSNSGNSKTEEPKEEALSAKLIGEWNNIYLKIDTYSKKNTDSTEVLEVTAAEWQDRLKIRPIRSFFRADSTWHSAHYDLKDSLFYDPSGKWWVNGDKLTMLQLKPSLDTTIYTFIIQNDTASFEAMIDWDGDGKKDDKYFGRQIKK